MWTSFLNCKEAFTVICGDQMMKVNVGNAMRACAAEKSLTF